MKRIHLFEFEDQKWFPNWLRKCLTRLIVVMHNLLGTSDELAKLLTRVLKQTGDTRIIDLCSGSGGPMLKAVSVLKAEKRFQNLELILTDLYPNKEMAVKINSRNDSHLHYHSEPVDATNLTSDFKGLRTMIGSFHHMRPEVARKILADAQHEKQAICILEISDNSFPVWIWWIAMPINFVMALFITPMARPLTFQQLFFTYIVPIIPLFFAWDGAVSNARTYTLADLDELLNGLTKENYKWEKGLIEGKSKKLYLLGLPG